MSSPATVWSLPLERKVRRLWSDRWGHSLRRADPPNWRAPLNRACLCLILFVSLAACGDGQPAQRVVPAEPGQTQVTPTGALEGYVRLAGGSRPTPTRVRNTTDPEVCGLEHSLEDLLASAETRGVQHVIATLVDVPTDRIPVGPPQRLVIDNHECRFIPHVAVARVGDTIVAQNSDPVLHTTHYYGSLTSNIALPVEGMTVSRVFRRPGMISVLCDVHGWMKAFVRVDDHPFHAVSDELGVFRISGIPPGSYTMELWHETLGTQQVQVEIRPNETARLDVEYALTPSRP